MLYSGKQPTGLIMVWRLNTWPKHPECSESIYSEPLSTSTKARGPRWRSHVPHFTSVYEVPSSVSPSHSPLPPWSWIPLTCRSCVQQSEEMFPLVGLHFPRTSASWTLSLSIHPHGINHCSSEGLVRLLPEPAKCLMPWTSLWFIPCLLGTCGQTIYCLCIILILQ